MNFNSEQLALAANFWWPTFALGTVVATQDSIASKSLDVSKSVDNSTSLSFTKLLKLLPILDGQLVLKVWRLLLRIPSFLNS